MGHEGGKIKEVEEFPRRVAIFGIIIAILMVVGTLGFMFLLGMTPQRAFIKTLETFVFLFEEENKTARYLEIFLALIGVFIIWWTSWSVADMLLDGNLTKYLRMRYYSSKIENMKEHIIIVGGGRVGEELAVDLTKKKIDFIIVEKDEDLVHTLRKKKYKVIAGDGTKESVMKDANIKTASKVVITIPDTGDNILTTMNAKELNPKIEIYARAENPQIIPKLKKAGAKEVIVPEIVAGDDLADLISKK